MRFLYTIVERIVRKAEREVFMAHLRKLNMQGHSISLKAKYGKRLEFHAGKNSRIIVPNDAEILHDTWIITNDEDTLTLHENVFISQHCTISGSVTIGKNTLIAGFVTIIDANHVIDRTDIPIREQGGRSLPIVIGEDVWIGASSTVLPGVTIGAHAVIGANSTVTKDIPAWAVAVGSPAAVVKMRER